LKGKGRSGMAGARTNPLTEAEEAVLRRAPHLHTPRLVVSRDIHGAGVLDQLADVVSKVVGSMWTFVIVTTLIVVWLFAGNVVGFDRTPWPLLLTVLNLPQLSIMISLQVAANRAQAASDARAIAAYETLVALHEISKQQLGIEEGQSKILDGQNQVLEVVQKAVTAGKI
jgi:low affinity Fe/Cu permease